MNERLIRAYHETTYATIGTPKFEIRIGRENPELNDFLRFHGYASWVFITAENPFSQPQSPKENLRNNQDMLDCIRQQGFVYLNGLGRPDNDSWTAEKSFLVFDIGKDQAQSLAKCYRQNAIVFGRVDQLPELILLSYD